MMNQGKLKLIGALVLVFGAAGATMAQATAPMVSVTGSSSIKVQPDELRIAVSLEGQGKDVKEAMAKLAAAREDARKKILRWVCPPPG